MNNRRVYEFERDHQEFSPFQGLLIGKENNIMSDQNKALSRRVVEEGYDKGNMTAIGELFAANHVNHSAPPGIPAGVEGIKAFVGMYRTAFPDLRNTVSLQVAEGDKVVTHWSATGTNKGSFMGMPPTGKSATITGTTIDRIAGGKIVETWTTFDQVQMMQQLGVIPAPGH
jgi:steroid delta-isomerase-like uncharacterized protein